MHWLFLSVVVGYLLVLVVFWTLFAVAASADDVDLFDPVPEPPARPCPLCTSSDVYVDHDDVALCITCRASYSLNNWEHLP